MGTPAPSRQSTGLHAATAVLAALALIAPMPGAAQCLLCVQPTNPDDNSSATALPERPLTVDVVADLDFSRLVAGAGGGSLSLDPRTGASREGAIESIGGGGFVGRVHITGTPLREVQIDLPDSIELTGSRGDIVRVTNIATNLPADSRLGPDGTLDFAFGGRLTLSGSASGDYRGRIAITVSYN